MASALKTVDLTLPTPTLADVLPAAARSLGVADTTGIDHNTFDLPQAQRVCVVLVDGMGAQLIEERSGHAPNLRSMNQASSTTLRTTFPSTTAVALGTFGTGLPPGSTGLLGYTVLDPDSDRVVNQLTWESSTPPEKWQRHPTIFDQCTAAGVAVTHIGEPAFEGSGMTRAALRGARFDPAPTLEVGVDLALGALTNEQPQLIHLYHGALDKAGHVHGWQSGEWTDELERFDRELHRLRESAPPGTLFMVTADHGMVDVPREDRFDLAEAPDMLAGVRHLSGEPRAMHVHVEQGRIDEVYQRWTECLGDRARVFYGRDLIDSRVFGDVDDHVRPIIGDLVVASLDRNAIVYSGVRHLAATGMIGMHGSITEAEMNIPLLWSLS